MESEKIQKEINELTNKLREEKPTVYKNLIENPITLPDKHEESFIEGLKQYKSNLEELLKINQ